MFRKLMLIFVVMILNLFFTDVYAQMYSTFEKVIDMEASQVELKPVISKDSDTKTFDVLKDSLPAGLSYRQFGSILRSYFMGSYYYFGKLDEASRRKVYQLYQKSVSLSEIRETIVQLSVKIQ